MNKLKEQLKMLITTREGWFSWFIANVITSLPWILPLVYGFVFKDQNAYVLATAIWAFLLSPLAPLWIVNVVIAVFIRNKIIRGSRVS